MPRINLLPWREQQRTDRKKAFGVGLGAAFLGAAILAGLAYVFFGQMIESQRARNNLLRDEIKKLDKQIEQINNFEQQKQQNLARMQIIEKLQQSRPEIVHVFDTFTKIVPDGVYLTSLAQTEQRFKIVGMAQTPSRVSPFMEAIESSEWLTEPEVELIESKPVGHEFTMYAKQRVSAADEATATSAANATQKQTTP
jgi:type IV pilus assembly protein PilN